MLIGWGGGGGGGYCYVVVVVVLTPKQLEGVVSCKWPAQVPMLTVWPLS